MGFIDTHSHILLDDDRPLGVLNRALSLDKIGLIALSFHDLSKAFALKRAHPDKYTIAFGIYPQDGQTMDKVTRNIYYQTMDHPWIDIIGEIGLEYHWTADENLRAIQREVFIEQIQIANKLNKPIAIHTRDAWQDTLKIIKTYPCRGLIHCFSGSVEVMQECIKAGYYISFAGPITFKNANKLLEAVRQCPLDRILSETDSPYMTPVPLRGKPNEPYYVRHVVEKIAELKGIKTDQMAAIIKKNYLRFLNPVIACEIS